MVTNKSTLKQDLVNHQVPMTTYDDLTLLYTDTQHFSDVLISSYLYKKQGSTTAPNKLGIDNKSTTAGVSGPSDTANSHHWFAKGGFHSYWCVLRRGQFSYYKDKSERKPVDVIPADQILEFRYLEEEHRLDFYANHKTLSFWSESNEVLRSWNTALQEFVADRRRASLPMKLYDSENEEVDNESEYDDDDDFEILSEVARPRNGQSKEPTAERFTFKVPDEDREFYATYSPELPHCVIRTGTLFCKVKKRLGRKTWKKVVATLENTRLLIKSVSSAKVYKTVDLNDVVDSVEEVCSHHDTGFAVITYDERLKFRALNERDTIDWIMTLKSCVLVRKKLGALKASKGS